MKLGIGLPTILGNHVSPATVLDWARDAEAAGFHALAVHDKPNHDTWEPLATLAMVAPLTQRIRLVTAAILLPTRDEAILAKQAAMVDLVSGGRLDLGVVPGGRSDDFELTGRAFAGRGRRFEHQLARVRDLWADAWSTRESGAAMGPASGREPRPMLWVGGYTEDAIGRAVRSGDGFIFGAPGPAMMAERIPRIRAAAEAAGRPPLPVAGLLYVLPSDDPDELAEGERWLTRYYGQLRKPFAELVAHGSPGQILEAVRAHEAAGLDVLHLLPVTGRPDTVRRLADGLLRTYSG